MYYGVDADVYDVNRGERVFLTPYKKRATRLLDRDDEPSYEVARGRILGAVLGSEGVDELEWKLKKGQGSNSVRSYVAEFQSVVKTLQQLLQGAIDQRRYAKDFLRGLNPSVKQFIQIPERGESDLVVLYEAAKAAAARTSLLGDKDSPWGAAPAGKNQGQDKFQVHPSRQQLFVPKRAAVIPPLFSGEEKLETIATDPEVSAFVSGLNMVQTPMEYLTTVADMGGIPLHESNALLADLNSLQFLHGSLKGALVNVSSPAQLRKVLLSVFPRKFRTDKTEPFPRQAPSAPVARVNETLNSVQDQLLNFKNEIFDRLKEAQKSNAREQNNMLERLNAAEHFDRSDRKGWQRSRGEGNDDVEPKKFENRVMERLNALQQSQDANKRKWDTAFEDRNRRSKDEERKGRSEREEARGGSGEKGVKCFECNQEGHRKAECPKLRRGSGRSDDECRFCKKPGHVVEDCEMRKDHVCKGCGQKGHSKIWCTPKECIKCNSKHSPLNGCPRRG